MIEDIKHDAEQRMKKSVLALHDNLGKMRTGRANPSLVEQVMVPYYGVDTPLTQLANISVADARNLLVSPWEKNIIPDIEKAIMQADLGLNPVTSGDQIRIPLPALTEERRKELVKKVKAEAEHTRIAIRNIRRDANNDAKELLKEKEINEDSERRLNDAIQKLTDKYIAEIDVTVSRKEKDLLEI
ncbi:MAG: ribosome recycling factor [Gammaproteobacteria bacterium]|nr:ribosome recycling factor [Gammaproteobacteria bacterium]